jgi:hypothetical protein
VTELVRAGARWRPEPPGDEHFDHAACVMSRGWGDCDDWAPLKAAEMRVYQQDPGARAEVERSGPNRWHAKVTTSSGTKIDPSREAGMPSGGVSGAGPSICAPMTTNGRPAWAIKPVPGAIAARVDMPWKDARGGTNLSSLVHAMDPFQALCTALRGACIAGSVCGTAEPEHVAKLAALEALLRGIPPELIQQHLSMQGYATVGFAPLIPMAASALPGLTSMLPGPLKSLIPGASKPSAPKKAAAAAAPAAPAAAAPARGGKAAAHHPAHHPAAPAATSTYQAAPIPPPGPIIIKF